MASPAPKDLGPSKTIAKKARSGSVSLDAKELEKDVAALSANSPSKSASETPEKPSGSPGPSCCDADAASPTAGDSQDDPSFAAEYDVKHPTGDKMRDKVRGLLAAALLSDDKDAALAVASAIEAAMHNKFSDNGGPYKNKYRALSFNLKDAKNQKLRDAVLQRRLAPSRLIEMTSEELANDELKATREKVKEKMTREAMPYNKTEATTDMFRCGKCKQRKCVYHQMQTRSADEPMTTFVQCVVCGNRWKHAG